MRPHSLSDWLSWQETLNPAEIELGLVRVRSVAESLPLLPPVGHIFIVAGTNGKGSCAAFLEAVLRNAGLKTGLYSSPHLLRYNERIRVAGTEVSDSELVSAFESIEAVRTDTPLTFFEYGTLAALLLFSAARCDAWVLEVGLGGRLDAVNIVDPDFCLITTVDIDHQQWLGNTREKIAAEKAGIIRQGKPVFYGDTPVPRAILRQAHEQDAPVKALDIDFAYRQTAEQWSWQGAKVGLAGLPLPPGRGDEQLRNISLALAALESYDPDCLGKTEVIGDLIRCHQLPGRFQLYQDDYLWVLDVAHNRQSARALRDKLMKLGPAEGGSGTIIVGMLADKQAEEFAGELAEVAGQWISCPTPGVRGSSAAELADRIEAVSVAPVVVADSVADAMAIAQDLSVAGGQIIICGSFTVVGPALEQLGLY